MRRTSTMVMLVLLAYATFAGSEIAESGTALVAQASAKPARSATLDEVVDKYVQAVGGKDAIQKVTSRVMTGSIESPATGDAGSLVPGAIEVDEKAPNKRVVDIIFPGTGEDHQGFDGVSGWFVDPDEGPQDLPAAALPSVKLESEFYREIHLRDLFPKMALKGTTKVNGQDAVVVEAPHADGTIEAFYFDAASGLLVRDDVPVDVPDEGHTTVENDFSDYRDVDGVKLPFAIHQTSPDFEYIIKFKEIRQNVPIDDAKFQKPKGQ